MPSALDLDFGRAAVGVATGGHTLTLINTAATPALIARVTIHGAEAGDFAVVSDRCSRSVLAPGERCVLVLSATPRAAGSRAAGLEVDAEVRASGVSLHAEGIADLRGVELDGTKLRGCSLRDARLDDPYSRRVRRDARPRHEDDA